MRMHRLISSVRVGELGPVVVIVVVLPPPRGSDSSGIASCTCTTPAGHETRSDARAVLLPLLLVLAKRNRCRGFRSCAHSCASSGAAASATARTGRRARAGIDIGARVVGEVAFERFELRELPLHHRRRRLAAGEAGQLERQESKVEKETDGRTRTQTCASNSHEEEPK